MLRIKRSKFMTNNKNYIEARNQSKGLGKIIGDDDLQK